MNKKITVILGLCLMLSLTLVSANAYSDMTFDELLATMYRVEAKQEDVSDKLDITTKPKKIDRLNIKLDRLDERLEEIYYEIQSRIPIAF